MSCSPVHLAGSAAPAGAAVSHMRLATAGATAIRIRAFLKPLVPQERPLTQSSGPGDPDSIRRDSSLSRLAGHDQSRFVRGDHGLRPVHTCLDTLGYRCFALDVRVALVLTQREQDHGESFARVRQGWQRRRVHDKSGRFRWARPMTNAIRPATSPAARHPPPATTSTMALATPWGPDSAPAAVQAEPRKNTLAARAPQNSTAVRRVISPSRCARPPAARRRR